MSIQESATSSPVLSTDDHDDMMGPRSTDTQSSIQVAHVLQQNITGKMTPVGT